MRFFEAKKKKTHVTVFTENDGKPDGVSNAAKSISPRSSARAKSIGSPETAYAERSPPRYRITVSKNGA